MVDKLTRLTTPYTLLQTLVIQTFRLYCYIMYDWTERIYDRILHAYTNYPFSNAPVLYLYSLDDPLCDVSAINDLINYQKEHGCQVFSRKWLVSAHAQHIIQHPIEYKSALTQFLMRIDAGNNLLANSRLC